jgi:hypothetical protein
LRRHQWRLLKQKGPTTGHYRAHSLPLISVLTGLRPPLLVTFSGADNVGGPFTGQEVAEDSVTGSSCTAPDGSVGSVFDLVQGVEVVTYQQGQLYTAGTGTSAGTGCQSNTTGSFIVSQKHTVTGGTGKFVNASGTYGGTSIGQALAAPGAPPGRFGIFGAFQGTESGAIDKLK